MPLTINAIEDAAQRAPATRRTLQEARSAGMPVVFLCHSHLDKHLIKGVIALVGEAGWLVYVDWADPAMPETPDIETAARLQAKIREARFLLFLATANSMASRWCPWEIGYADGVKSRDRILILPTADATGTRGSEYLRLYRRIDRVGAAPLLMFEPGQVVGMSLSGLR